MKKILILIFTIGVIPLFAGTSHAGKQYYNGHWYEQIFVETSNWYEAQDKALELGGNLVTINDEYEQTWLHTNFDPLNLYWIGLNDAREQGTWEWVSGEPVNYTNWMEGAPDTFPFDKHWVVMNYLEGQFGGGFWNNIPVAGDPASPYHPPEALHNAIVEGVVPEPASMLLFGLGGIALAAIKMKRKT